MDRRCPPRPPPGSARRTLAAAAFVAAAALVAGCHSAGPYGHSRVYTPLDQEAQATSQARELDLVMAQRFPDRWRQPVSFFGVVTNRGVGPGRQPYLAVSLRVLEPRNLCESSDEDSCRVTISDRELGKVHVLLGAVRPEDEVGEGSIGVGSLVRVVGTIAAQADPDDGTPVIGATYYRHWPRAFYVTTRAAAVMHR
jgi:hypothetical protein